MPGPEAMASSSNGELPGGQLGGDAAEAAAATGWSELSRDTTLAKISPAEIAVYEQAMVKAKEATSLFVGVNLVVAAQQDLLLTAKGTMQLSNWVEDAWSKGLTWQMRLEAQVDGLGELAGSAERALVEPV